MGQPACVPQVTGPHLHGSIDSCVRAQAEVRAGHIVADGGWDDTHDDAKLLVARACLHQLQHALVGLWAGEAREPGEVGLWFCWHGDPISISPCSQLTPAPCHLKHPIGLTSSNGKSREGGF
jgi:hypothetical protein